MDKPHLLPTKHPEIKAEHTSLGLKLTHQKPGCLRVVENRGGGIYSCGCGLILDSDKIFPIPQVPVVR